MSGIVATNQTILIVGGGISGMTAALEAAEVGKQVILQVRHQVQFPGDILQHTDVSSLWQERQRGRP